jgi:hypothetical protein
MRKEILGKEMLRGNSTDVIRRVRSTPPENLLTSLI